MLATKTTVREWQPWYRRVWNWVTSDQAPIAVIEYKAQRGEDMKVGTFRMALTAESTKKLQAGKRYNYDMDVVNIIDVEVMPDPLILEPLTFDE